jgi:S1-C subfamily serine protease
MIKIIALILILALIAINTCSSLLAEDKISVAAPMTTDLAGRSGSIATLSVYRVICPKTNLSGTAFLHKSGNIITAAHVVEKAEPSEILILGSEGKPISVRSVVNNRDLDLALLKLHDEVSAKALLISEKKDLAIGSQISAWGYPAGYQGLAPLLISGYVSGVDFENTPSGGKAARLVVNAAFNSGNSGGPVVNIETGEVIGVVSSKLAPLPAEIESVLNALKNTKYGLGYTIKKPDGTSEKVMEGQLIEKVLQYLRQQVQLVIGYAVTVQDLKKFLNAQGIEP